MTIRFTVPGAPFGKQRPRGRRIGNHIQIYTPQETQDYEQAVSLCCKAAMARQGAEMFPAGVPLELFITARFAVPASFSKRNRELALANVTRPTKKPDYDNIAKIISDALNGVAYRDDAAICRAVVCKEWAAEAGVDVEISAIE